MKLKQFYLNEDTQRRVYGKLLGVLDLDYAQDLSKLRSDLEEALTFLLYVPGISKKIKRVLKDKDVRVYQGSHHLDVVVSGVGGLNWLTVTDSPVINQELPPLKPLDVSLSEVVKNSEL